MSRVACRLLYLRVHGSWSEQGVCEAAAVASSEQPAHGAACRPIELTRSVGDDGAALEELGSEGDCLTWYVASPIKPPTHTSPHPHFAPCPMPHAPCPMPHAPPNPSRTHLHTTAPSPTSCSAPHASAI